MIPVRGPGKGSTTSSSAGRPSNRLGSDFGARPWHEAVLLPHTCIPSKISAVWVGIVRHTIVSEMMCDRG